MSAYEQAAELIAGMGESFGLLEELSIEREGREPVLVQGHFSPPMESEAAGDRGTFEIVEGSAWIPPGADVRERDRIRRGAAEDDRVFVVSGVMSRSAAGTSVRVVEKKMLDAYQRGDRAMRGGRT